MSTSSCSSPILAVRGGRSDLEVAHRGIVLSGESSHGRRRNEAYGANINDDNKTPSRRTTASQLGSAKPRSLAATYTGTSSTSNNTIATALSFFDDAARTTTPSPAGTPQKKKRFDIPSGSCALDGAVQGSDSLVSLSAERGPLRGENNPAGHENDKSPSCTIIRGNGALAVAVPVTITAPPIPSLSLRPSSKNLRSLATPVAGTAHISPCAHNTWVGHDCSNDTIHTNGHTPLTKHSSTDPRSTSSVIHVNGNKAAASIPPSTVHADTSLPSSSSWHLSPHSVSKDEEKRVGGSHGGGGGGRGGGEGGESLLVFKSEGSGSIPRGRISGGSTRAAATVFGYITTTTSTTSTSSSGHSLLDSLTPSTVAVGMPLSLRHTEALPHSSKKEVSPNISERETNQQTHEKEDHHDHDSDRRMKRDERGDGTGQPITNSSSRSPSRCVEGNSGAYSSTETHTTTAGINAQSGAKVMTEVKIKNCPRPSPAAAVAGGHQTESFILPKVSSSSSPLSSSFSSYYSSSSNSSSSSLLGAGNADTPCTRKIRRNERKRRRRKELDEKRKVRGSVVTCEPDNRSTEGSTSVYSKIKQPCESVKSTAGATLHQPAEEEKGEREGTKTVREPEVAQISQNSGALTHPHPHPPSTALAATKGPERRPYVALKATAAAGENEEEEGPEKGVKGFKVADDSGGGGGGSSLCLHPRADGDESSEDDDADGEGAAGLLLYSTSCFTYSEEVEHPKSEDKPHNLKNSISPPFSKSDDRGDGHANSQPRVCRQNILIVPTLHPDATRNADGTPSLIMKGTVAMMNSGTVAVPSRDEVITASKTTSAATLVPSVQREIPHEKLVVPSTVLVPAEGDISLALEIDADKDDNDTKESGKNGRAQEHSNADAIMPSSSSARRRRKSDELTVAGGGSGPSTTVFGVTDAPLRSVSPELLERTQGQSPSRSRASVAGTAVGAGSGTANSSFPMKKRSASTVRESASALRGTGRGAGVGVGVSVVGGGAAASAVPTKAGGGCRASTAALPNTRGSLTTPLGVSGNSVVLEVVRQGGVVERERRIAPPPPQQRKSTVAFGRRDSTIAKARRQSTEANRPEYSCTASIDKTSGSQRSSPLLNNTSSEGVQRISAVPNVGDGAASALLPSPSLALATPCGASGKQQASSAGGSGGAHSSSAASNSAPQRNVPPSKVVAGAPKSVPSRPGVKDSFQNQKTQQGGNVSTQQQQRQQKGTTAANNSRRDQQQTSLVKDRDTGNNNDNNNNNQRHRDNPLTSGGPASAAANIPINKWVSAAGLTEHDLRRIRIYMLNTMLREEAEAVWAGEAEGDRIDGV